MTQEENSSRLLSTTSGFNAAVRHIKKTAGISEALETGKNLADILRGPGYEDFSGLRALPLLRLLLIDKRGYRAFSANPLAIAADIPALSVEFAAWKAVDLVIACHDPLMGLIIANPKRAEQMLALGKIHPRELLVVYAGKASGELCLRAAQTALALFGGAKTAIAPELYRDGGEGRAPDEPVLPTKVPAGPVTPARFTPLYSVPVTNELFHNGNVEAWKRIISAYISRYPGCTVQIYYDGERILDINALFTWGKVKHGGVIQFAVTGRDIKDVSKLQRYLAQGASREFEPFLQTPAHGGLKLF
ncbi:hypothetical protein AGMMS4952_01370 [Spirochaetia bacterium]|nr:hypothetical protein AGMMS4952_01370 [Spirochaetia bacterium]